MQIKQSSTAYALVFLMVDSTDHVTPKTGLSPTVTISKNGGSFGSPSGSVTEIANGWYKVAGNATDAATLGSLILHATGTAADPCDMLFEVVAYDPQDAVRYGLSSLPNAAANANGGLPILSSSGTTLAYTLSTLTTYTGNTLQTGDSFARIGALGAGLTSLAPSATALSTAVWTGTIAGRIDAAVSSRMATFTYTAPDNTTITANAAALAAIAGGDTQVTVGLINGISISDLNTQIARFLAMTNSSSQFTADAFTLAAIPTAAQNAAGLLDLSNGIETGLTPRQALRGAAAVLLGVSSNEGATIKGAGVATTRVTATVNDDGERTAITLNL